jgi:hypothetical protein
MLYYPDNSRITASNLETTPVIISISHLCELLDRHFNEEEVRSLCLELGVAYDNLGGRGKAANIRELVQNLHRQQRLPALVDVARQQRPLVAWPDPSPPVDSVQADALQDQARRLFEQVKNRLLPHVWSRDLENRATGLLRATAIWQPKNWWQPTNWEEATILLAGLYSDDCTEVLLWLADAQPELAARYPDNRFCPWGHDFDAAKANTYEGDEVGQTTAVGIYPHGANPKLNLHDLSGNVWEWCRNKYKNRDDEKIDSSGGWRVLRGGSWYSDHSNAGATARNLNHPVNRFFDVGWRVVLRRPPSHR